MMPDVSEEELFRLLEEGDPSERIRAAYEVAARNVRGAAPALRRTLAGGDPLLRVAAGFALWKITGGTEGIQAVLDGLEAENDTPQVAMHALALMGEALIPLLERRLAEAPQDRKLRQVLHDIRVRAGSR